VNNELDGMWKEVVKAKDELVPVLNKLSKCMRNGSITPPFLTSPLDGGECLGSGPCRYNPGKEPPVPIR
jgi:hypothetical protein